MNEDRRPNIAGRDIDLPKETESDRPSEKDRELEAKTMRKRTSADGHEPPRTRTAPNQPD